MCRSKTNMLHFYLQVPIFSTDLVSSIYLFLYLFIYLFKVKKIYNNNINTNQYGPIFYPMITAFSCKRSREIQGDLIGNMKKQFCYFNNTVISRQFVEMKSSQKLISKSCREEFSLCKVLKSLSARFK